MGNNADLRKERDKIIQGLEEAYKRLVAFKKTKNSPLVIAKNGEVTEISPHEISPTTSYKRKLG